jgi:hypothetical protein
VLRWVDFVKSYQNDEDVRKSFEAKAGKIAKKHMKQALLSPIGSTEPSPKLEKVQKHDNNFPALGVTLGGVGLGQYEFPVLPLPGVKKSLKDI